MSSRLLLIGVMIVVGTNVFSQHQVSELISGSVVPVDENGGFTDAFKSFLKSELDGVRVLALGEASHEDGTTFEQKAQLIKFLHEELDFRVLAFEYGFYGNYKADQMLTHGAKPDSAFRYAGWAKSVYAYPAYEYIAQTYLTVTPLYYAGFDGEKVPDGVPNIKAFITALNAQLDTVVLPAEMAVVDSLIGAVYGGISNPIRSALTYAQRNRAKSIIDRLIHALPESRQKLSMDEREWTMTQFTLHSILMDEKSAFAGNFWNIVRDKHMAERIVWLADSIYKGAKIMLWGASGHFARNMIEIERNLQPGDYGFYPFYQSGDWLYQHFGDAYYALAFVAGQGEVGTVYPKGHKFKAYEELRTLELSETESYESIALQTDKNFLYTSLRNATQTSWMNGAFTAHPLGYREDNAQWKSVFDGFYFMRQMKPDRW